MFRLLQISDTHLAHDNGIFEDNFDAARRMAASLEADLVVNTGDMSLDGSEREADLLHAAKRHREIDREVLTIPGNHDVGETHGLGNSAQAIDEVKLARYRDHFGPDWWVRDVNSSWRLVGLNSLLLGSGLAEEQRQATEIAVAIGESDGRAVAVFMHKPLYLKRPDEPPGGYFTIPPDFRAPYDALIDHPNVRLVATGHLHQCAIHIRGDRTHAWAPSTAFVAGPMRRQELGGAHELGVVLHELGPGGAIHSRILPVPTLRRLVSEELLEGRSYPHFRKTIDPLPS